MSTDTVNDTVASNKQSDAEPETEAVAGAELEVLRAENERLREQFQEAKRTTYRRTAIAFLVVGFVSIGGAVLFPSVRTLLGVLGGTGVFAAILTYFITPEEFHAASVSEQIFDATAKNGDGIVEELGLQDSHVYVPVGERGARLYVPTHRNFVVPDDRALQSIFVVTGDERERGISLHPTGGSLYEEFDTIATETADIEQRAAQLSDAVVEQFELARGVETTVVPAEGDARFDISGSSCGQIQDFDQPIVSLLATGLAKHLEEPVQVEFPSDDGDDIVRCMWESSGPDA